MGYSQWSTTAADNDDAATGINWTEGQAPNTVNDSARQMMADVAQLIADQTDGSFNPNVVVLAALDAEPASPVEGAIYRANGTDWDPSSLAGSDPYTVIYEGGVFRRVTGGDGLSGVAAYQEADESTTSGALVSSSYMTVTLAANAVYEIKSICYLTKNSADVASCTLVYSGTPVASSRSKLSYNPSGSADTNYQREYSNSGASTPTGGTDYMCIEEGTLFTDGTGGTLTVKFYRVSGSAAAVVLKKASILKATRVA